ncbi:MAG: hypothetical protein MRY77_14495 [Rhodobacteraceae bacterium]|nr:hypothetical protein [Paracoccaceae bacterium]
MQELYEVTLIGPAKINGKRRRVGENVSVNEQELRSLVKAQAVSAGALEKLLEEPSAGIGQDSDALVVERDEAMKKAEALQSLNEELVKTNRALKEECAAAEMVANNLKGKLDAAEEDKAKLAEEIAKADLVISELKAGAPEEKDATQTPPKPATKTAPKATSSKAAKS